MKKLNLMVSGDISINIDFYKHFALVKTGGETFFLSYPLKDETNIIEGDKAIEMIKDSMLENERIADVQIDGNVVVKRKEVIGPVWIKLSKKFLTKPPQNMSFKSLNSLRFNNMGVNDSAENVYSNLFLKFGTRIGEIKSSDAISYVDDVLKKVDVFRNDIDDQIIRLLTEKYTTYVPADDTFMPDIVEQYTKALIKGWGRSVETENIVDNINEDS